ncbi:MAG: LysR family transcriptional regulator, partial [Burkholderiales bacterium]|nr:LysR family transcriptional regulator [Burkholderiales bacterium]
RRADARQRRQTAPRGRLKVSVPMPFGILHTAPAVPEFFAAYPDIAVDMTMDDRVVDLVVAVRIARLAESSVIARKLAPSRMVVCASPAYLATHGMPTTPEDLARQNCIVYSYSPTPDVWRLTAPDGSELAVSVRGIFR